MDSNRFVVSDSDPNSELVIKNLTCSICLNVLIEPVQDGDGHTFCRKCIKTWLETNSSCPMDRKHLTANDLKDAPRNIKNLLCELKIYCDFKQNGCNEIVKWESLENHEGECEFNLKKIIKCEHCGTEIQRLQLKDHNCLAELKKECQRLQCLVNTSNEN